MSAPRSGAALAAVFALQLVAGAGAAQANLATKDPLEGAYGTTRAARLIPCEDRATEVTACGAAGFHEVPGVGRLSTSCQLTGPRLLSSTQRGNPILPEVGRDYLPPYGTPAGWFETVPGCTPIPVPSQTKVTNHHDSFNAACDLDRDGTTKCDPFFDHRLACAGTDAIAGTDLGIPVLYREPGAAEDRLVLVFGDTSSREPRPSAEDVNVVTAASVLGADRLSAVLEAGGCLELEPSRERCTDPELVVAGSAPALTPYCDAPGCLRVEHCSIRVEDATLPASVPITLQAERKVTLEPGVRIPAGANFTARVTAPERGSLQHGIPEATFTEFLRPVLDEHLQTIAERCHYTDAGDLELLRRTVRAIPIAALRLDGRILVYYQASENVGYPGGSLGCGLTGLNFIGLAESTDGRSFTPVAGAHWGPEPSVPCAFVDGQWQTQSLPERPRFLLAALEAETAEGRFVYTYWSQGYRKDRLYVARVEPEHVAEPARYRFKTASGTWVAPPPGAQFPADAADMVRNRAADDHLFSEMSIAYNAYIGAYVALYVGMPRPVAASCPVSYGTLDPFVPIGYRMQILEAPDSAFDFAPPYHFQLTAADLASNSSAADPGDCSNLQWKRRLADGSGCFGQVFHGTYGAFQHPALTGRGGRDVYFVTSSWGHYNTFLLKLELDPCLQQFDFEAPPPCGS